MKMYAWIIIGGIGFDILFLLLTGNKKIREDLINKRIPNFIVCLPFIGRILGWW